MGQYYKIVNLDKREYLTPHGFNDGAKLMEFGHGGTCMTALTILLSHGNGRGGGDFRPAGVDEASDLVGHWAGDRIVIAGDYADNGAPGFSADTILYRLVEDDKWSCLDAVMMAMLTRAGEV